VDPWDGKQIGVPHGRALAFRGYGSSLRIATSDGKRKPRSFYWRQQPCFYFSVRVAKLLGEARFHLDRLSFPRGQRKPTTVLWTKRRFEAALDRRGPPEAVTSPPNGR